MPFYKIYCREDNFSPFQLLLNTYIEASTIAALPLCSTVAKCSDANKKKVKRLYLMGNMDETLNI